MMSSSSMFMLFTRCDRMAVRAGKPWKKGNHWYVYLHKTVSFRGRKGKFRLKLKALDGRWE